MPAAAGLDYGLGIVCLLMVTPHVEAERIAQQLLVGCEDYLRQHGARVLCGGGFLEPNPFYLGLCGGSGSWGMPAADMTAVRTFRAAGYQEVQHWLIYQRELAGFRPPVDRHLIQLRRQLPLEPAPDALPADWWEACVYGQVDQTHFVVAPSAGEPAWGTAAFWDVEPIASSWGVHAMGLLQISVFHGPAEGGQEIVATHLLGESLRQLHAYGVTRAEIQANSCDSLLNDVCQRLGFREVDRAVGFRKTL